MPTRCRADRGRRSPLHEGHALSSVAGRGEDSRPFVAVLDYGIGNLRSAEKALQHVGADARLVTDVDEAGEATGVVLPGVGAFGPCAAALRRSGLDRAANEALSAGRPFLGICVGLQLMYGGSEESPGVAGLGFVEGEVRRLPNGVKHPQMQWNRLEPVSGGQGTSQLLAAVGPEAWTYFVHSFAPPGGPDVVATCDYGGPVVAAIERGVAWGVQFHPEKSAEAGLRLLRGFVELCRREEAP